MSKLLLLCCSERATIYYFQPLASSASQWHIFGRVTNPHPCVQLSLTAADVQPCLSSRFTAAVSLRHVGQMRSDIFCSFGLNWRFSITDSLEQKAKRIKLKQVNLFGGIPLIKLRKDLKSTSCGVWCYTNKNVGHFPEGGFNLWVFSQTRGD